MRRALTISAKVRTAEALALLIIFAVGATALARTVVVARRVERFAGEQFPDTLLLAQIAQGRLDADRSASAVFALAERSPELRDEVDGEAEVALAAVDEGMKSYESRPRTAGRKAEWAEVARAVELWRAAVAQFLEVSRAAPAPDREGDARLAAWQAARAASQDAERALLAYLTKVAGEVQQVRAESTSSTRIALWIIGLALVAGASVHLVGGRLLRRSVSRSLATLVGEAHRLEEAVANGELDVRGVPDAVSVEFRPVVEGLNKTLDAFVWPLRRTAGHIDRIARGEIPEKESRQARGEFEVLRKNLNQCIADLDKDRARLAETQKQLLLAERLSTIGSLAAGVAHEVNSPLSAVVADLAFLAREAPALLDAAQAHPGDATLPERTRELAEVLQDARAAAQRVAGIVRDLAEVARPEPSSSTRVAVQAVLETALTLASGKLEGQVRVVREMGPVPPVRANAAQLARVFVHLLVDAAQAVAASSSQAGEIRVSLRTDERGRAVVEVRHEDLARPPGERAPTEPSSPRPATAQAGLGLAVCHGIVSSLGGTLEAESVRGGGSVRRVVLPAAAPAEDGGDAPAGP